MFRSGHFGLGTRGLNRFQQNLTPAAIGTGIWIRFCCIGMGAIALSFWCSAALAQATLTQAEVYKINNRVEINRQDQGNWSPASVGATLVPRDAVRTAAQSRAELLFNEGTLVRTGEGTIFRFPPGRRSFELVDGSAVIMIRPGQGSSTITTPQAIITTHGTALFIQHSPTQNASVVGVLTDSPAGPVTVSDAAGHATVQLNAGQFVSVANGVIGLVENFILPMFYQSVDLAAGLAAGQESAIASESPEVQTTLNAVRAETLEPLKNQTVWLQSFCRANAGMLQNLLQDSPLLRLVLPGSIPSPQVTLQIPQSDLVVAPVRSLAGLMWLGTYCESH
ncbi:MAG TPA: FecR family protein [Coleofasciculaceae cyanobacterium]